jgi:hypothetical protein
VCLHVCVCGCMCVCARGMFVVLSYLGWGRCWETHQQMALTLGIIGLALAMPLAHAAEILKKYSLLYLLSVIILVF